MQINLIPQPQIIRPVGEMSSLTVKELSVKMNFPNADERLIKAVDSLFSNIDISYQDAELYSLTFNIENTNYALARRVYNRIDGYVLNVGNNCFELYAYTSSGLFYGIKTIQNLLENYNNNLPQLLIVDWADTAMRSEYFDLRTIYPKFENMLTYIERMASFKLNTLVIEYEDKLPFQKLSFLKHKEYAFSLEQLKQIQKTAHDNFINIIPLQQTFGHLEYVLKHEPFKKLRETQEMVGEMCPLREGSFEIARDLIREISELHPEAKYLHLGCDEVWSLGLSDECKASGKTRTQIFIEFINRLTEATCSLDKIPLIWHDMIASCTEEELSNLDKRIIVVIWIYNGNNLKHNVISVLNRLRKVGIQVIGASAVRSGDCNGDQNYPVVHNRIVNLNGWSEIAKNEQLDGIINTNWASPFSLGRPYGLYETAIYTIGYAADRCWNCDGGRNTYLERFFHQFHGVLNPGLAEQGFLSEDYYSLIPRMLPQIIKNKEIAQLIEVMLEYEYAIVMHFPAHTQIFRVRMFPDKEEEVTSLRAKSDFTFKKLAENKISMQDIVGYFLTEPMKELFINSRFCLPELYEKEIEGLTKKRIMNN